MSEVTLETALEDLGEESDNAEELFAQYIQTKRYLEDEMYPWVQAECSWYTDHGEQHINSVINQASRLLRDELRNPEEGELNELDIFVLLTGILWHDVGMIVNRSEHDRISTEVSGRFQDMAFPSTGVKGTVDDIIKGHRNRSGLDIPQKNTSFNIHSRVYTLYPKALAGILRFADEISETQERVSGDSWVRSTVPEESQIFWRYAQSIQGCYPDINGKSIRMNIELTNEDASKMYPCPDPFAQRANADNEISLMEYLICRLEKLVNELAYCERYFNRYVEIREVELSLTIRDGERDIIKEINETLGATGLTTKGTYPDVTIYDDFFDAYSDWRPENLPDADSGYDSGSDPAQEN